MGHCHFLKSTGDIGLFKIDRKIYRIVTGDIYRIVTGDIAIS